MTSSDLVPRRRLHVIVSRFNPFITDALLKGALAVLHQHGCQEGDISIAYVPGALELPLAAYWAASLSETSAVICLGCVVKGATLHFEMVCHETARGIMDVGLRFAKPVISGVISAHTWEQALERSGHSPRTDKVGEKTQHAHVGGQAALAALDMLALLESY